MNSKYTKYAVLALLPVQDNVRPDDSQDVLLTQNDSFLYEEIDACLDIYGTDVPKHTFCCYLAVIEDVRKHPHYGWTNKDRYGNDLKFLTAERLLACFFSRYYDLSRINKAVMHYIMQLEKDHLVACYWR